MIRITIIHPHERTLAWIGELVKGEADMQLQAAATSWPGVLSQLARGELETDILLMEVQLWETHTYSMACARYIHRHFPHIRLCVISYHKLGLAVYQLYQWGIPAYLFQDSLHLHLVAAIRELYQGGIYYRGEPWACLLAHLQAEETQTAETCTFSVTERQVLSLLQAGMSPDEMAGHCDIDKNRLRIYCQHLHLKMNLVGGQALWQAPD